MDNETLMKIVNHAIGVVGYFDGRVDKIEQDDDQVIIHWHGACANPVPLVLNLQTGEPEKYTNAQREAARKAESIMNVCAFLPPDEEQDENLADSVRVCSEIARDILTDAGLDPDNTPTGIFT